MRQVSQVTGKDGHANQSAELVPELGLQCNAAWSMSSDADAGAPISACTDAAVAQILVRNQQMSLSGEFTLTLFNHPINSAAVLVFACFARYFARDAQIV